MLGKTEGRRRRGQPRMRWLDSITDVMSMNVSKFRETVEDRKAWRALVHGVTKSRTRLNNNNNYFSHSLLRNLTIRHYSVKLGLVEGEIDG